MVTSVHVSRNKGLETFSAIFSFIMAGLGVYFHDWYAVGIIGGSLAIAVLFYIWREMPMPAPLPELTRDQRLRLNGGSHTAAEWRAKCEEYNWRCASCRRKRPLTKDHIIAVMQGGTDDITNIQPLCRSCNSGKNDATFDYRAAYVCPGCGGQLDGGDYALLKSAQARGARFSGCKACRGKA